MKLLRLLLSYARFVGTPCVSIPFVGMPILGIPFLGITCVGMLHGLPSNADAALIEDGPTCRCLDNLSTADAADIDESTRRDAARIFDEYCEEDRALSDLSGSEQWIAEESCALLHRQFQIETDALDDAPPVGGVELRISVQARYLGRRVMNDYLLDWRHHMGVYGRLQITVRPSSMYGGRR